MSDERVDAVADFIKYKEKTAKTYNMSMTEVCELRIVKEVGLSYGLSEEEVVSVGGQ